MTESRTPASRDEPVPATSATQLSAVNEPASASLDQKLHHSLALAAAGNLAAAETNVRRLLQEHPEHTAAQLHLARLLLSSGRPIEAAALLRRLIVSPALPVTVQLEANLLLADAELRTGRLSEAEACGRRARALAPDDARACFTIAMVCQQTGRLDEALALLEDALKAHPDAFHGWVNKGLIEKRLGRFNRAIESLTQALTLNPSIAPAHYSLGLIYLMRGARGKAEQAFRHALAADPRHTHAAQQLATLLRYENRMNDAAEIYRTILEVTPGDVTARFHLDALCQPDGPTRVPANVVQATYADESVGRSLENSLQGSLHYQTPAILQAALQEIHGNERPVLDILDLGCGSGLYGALVQMRARRLVGVDLSAAMIGECRRKGVYNELHAGDIEDYLARTSERFDLIVAMDVLCYFGDLRPLIQHCARILKPGGILAFSVERSDGSAWLFHRYGHFVHSASHLRDAAQTAGLREIQMTECALRRELDEDRIGYVALFAAAEPNDTNS